MLGTLKKGDIPAKVDLPEREEGRTRDIAAQKAGIGSDRGVAIMTTAQVL